MTYYGERIKKRLIELRITQKDLARMIGVNETYISKIISGVRGGWKHRQKINEILWHEEEMEKAI